MRRGPGLRDGIDDSIMLLFALVGEAVARATAALLEQDVSLAEGVIADDKTIDDRCELLNGLLKERLGDAASDPAELETLVDMLQMLPELERSAALAEHIARRTLDGLGGIITPKSRGLIQSMGDAVVEMWQVAAASYQHRSREARFELVATDDKLDGLAAALVRQGADSGESRTAVDLALIARFYERLGDHAVNLAHRVDRMVAPRRLSPARISRRLASPSRSPIPGGSASPTAPRANEAGTSEAGAREAGTNGAGSTGVPLAARRGLRARLRRLRLTPTDDQFFELFCAAAANARDGATELSAVASSFPDLGGHLEQVRTLEHRGDELTIDLLRRLDSSFITPYDREDIHALADALDDVVDHIFAAVSLLALAKDSQPLPELEELAGILSASTEEMVALMWTLRVRQGARYRLERIEDLERSGDAAYRRSIGRLYRGEYELLDVIKWKDIVASIEASINAVEDVSDVVERILVKSA